MSPAPDTTPRASAPLSVLRHVHGERREPERGIGGNPKRLLGSDQPCEADHAWRTGEQVREQPVFEQRLDRAPRLRRHEDAAKLACHALCRELGESCAELHAGGETFGIERALAVIGIEAEEAEDAQIILLDAVFRLADEAHAPGDKIAIAAKRIKHRSVAIGIECVQGEVAALRVLLPILGEGDGRVPAVSLDVAPERRHLEGHAVNDHGHRAMLDPRRHGLEPSRLGERHHPLRQRRRGEIDFGDG